NYPFILAYLNSKLVSFLFKAKNIQIRRSKTKLEYGLPIPNIEKFNSMKKNSIIELIKLLTSYLIKITNSKCEINSVDLNNIIMNLTKSSYLKNEARKLKIIRALKNKNQNFIHHILDKLFFQLFDLNEKEVDSLIKKYY
ncbi:MAG: hypothetical protein ACFFG0_43445, partial [Candidatus Thorarchaeota archaeon]